MIGMDQAVRVWGNAADKYSLEAARQEAKQEERQVCNDPEHYDN